MDNAFFIRQRILKFSCKQFLSQRRIDKELKLVEQKLKNGFFFTFNDTKIGGYVLTNTVS